MFLGLKEERWAWGKINQLCRITLTTLTTDNLRSLSEALVTWANWNNWKQRSFAIWWWRSLKKRWDHTICTTPYYWILERMHGWRGVMKCRLCSHGDCDHSGTPLPAPNKLWSLCPISVPWTLLQFFLFPVHRYVLYFNPFSPMPAPVSWLGLSLIPLICVTSIQFTGQCFSATVSLQ